MKKNKMSLPKGLFSQSTIRNKRVLNRLLRDIENLNYEPGRLFGKRGYMVFKKSRHCNASHYKNSRVLAYLKKLATKTNNKLWNYKGPFTIDQAQISKYKRGHYFNWHSDEYKALSERETKFRVITIVALVSDHNEFDGGEFQIFTPGFGEQTIKLKSRGDVVIFPSHVLHRVKPIKSGLRKTLTLWLNVPNENRINLNGALRMSTRKTI